MGPQLAFSEELHADKYRGEGESFREYANRVASVLRDTEGHYQRFRDILFNQRFLPAGRVQSAIGSTRNVTAYNCFVSGIIEDSFVEGHGSIMDRVSEAASTMRMGGGIGYDFSTLRPRGAMIKKLQSRSSGPVSFMDIFDAVCRCVASSGHRRGAQMGVLRVDHPDVEEFIHAKQNETRLTGFNLSLAVTDEFMECVQTGKPFSLRWGGEVHKEVDASTLWEMIMRSTWDWAEPGVLFIDTINRMNNLYYCETITTTNPCGEQPLPPYGSCLLGSFNLTKYLTPHGGSTSSYGFEWDQFGEDVADVVRAMDNVVDCAIYPLYEQEKEAKSKRRMGLGVTGLANCLEAIGYPYGGMDFIIAENNILQRLKRETYLASTQLAAEKGSFPLFDRSLYLQGEFIKRLPEEVRAEIAQHGIRNSHLTSIAPTGTISLCADNVSSGIEPVFAYSFDRTVQEFDGPRVEPVQDYGVARLGVYGKVAADVSVDEHLAVLITAYNHVDSAVSKTCNVPSETSWDDFKDIYVQAWKNGCKGCTTFRTDGKRAGVLAVREDDSQPSSRDVVVKMEPACHVDPVTGRKECE